MAACAAFGCRRRPSDKIPGITFHKFPLNAERRTEWIKNVRRKNWMPSKYSQLCSDHFREDMIDRTSLCCVRLRANAVPTIFKGFPIYLQQNEKTRKSPLHRQQQLNQEDADVSLPSKDENVLCTLQSTNSPTKEYYKRKLEEADGVKIQYKKKVRALQQSKRRQKKAIENYKSIINEINI